MKKLILFSLLAVSTFVLRAQPNSSLSQNFDGICTNTTAFPGSWLRFNPITSTYQGMWTCDPTHGRGGSPGMSCTGVWSGAYHLDTAFLITPLLNLSGHAHAYLYFDLKADSIILGGSLKPVIYPAIHPTDTPFQDTNAHADLAPLITPGISVVDSGNWATHYVDLSSYIASSTIGFYITFMYVSTNTTGSQWFIDNVYTSFYRLDVPVVQPEILPVTVRGISTSSDINLSFGSAIQGSWQLSIFDMMGRQVYQNSIQQAGYTDTYAITDAGLAPGLYAVRMTNGTSYGSTKLSVH